MKKLLHVGLMLTLLLGMFSFTLPAYASTPNNYTVLVGTENTNLGVSVGSYFPGTVRIHVGDSVTWVANTHEIHTVTFLAGQPMPVLIIPAPPNMASPLQINPLALFPIAPAGGMYDGSTYANSGILSTDPGLFPSYTLTFTHTGIFSYLCLVHGMMMSGTVNVVPANVAVQSPAQVSALAQVRIKAAMAAVPSVLARANAQIVPPVLNPDGTLTHKITLGYESGNYMVMKFFPSQTTVHPGDTVNWVLSSTDVAPHTVTFYNGAADLSFVMIAFGPNGPVGLINPAVLAPSLAVLQGTPLNSTDFFNSGILMPAGQTTFSEIIGNITGTLNYECILHDTSGMTASLVVTPR